MRSEKFVNHSETEGVKYMLLILLLIYPRYSVLIFHDFPGVFLLPSSGSKMYHTNGLKISQKPMIFVLLICSFKNECKWPCFRGNMQNSNLRPKVGGV